MIAILNFLAKLSIVLGFLGVVFIGISDLVFKTNYIMNTYSYINLEDTKTKIIIVLVSLIYLIIFVLGYINKLTKYSQNRKVKTKVGELEVSVKTINEMSKEYLLSNEIIKNVKVKSYPKFGGIIIEASVDTYSTDKLNEKILKIQEELSENIFNLTGVSVKKSKINLKKVHKDTVKEKKEEVKVVQRIENQVIDTKIIEETDK